MYVTLPTDKLPCLFKPLFTKRSRFTFVFSESAIDGINSKTTPNTIKHVFHPWGKYYILVLDVGTCFYIISSHIFDRINYSTFVENLWEGTECWGVSRFGNGYLEKHFGKFETFY